MDWSSIISELPDTIPVVVGGLLAIGGGVAGQYLTERLTHNREEKKLIREKGEALVRALYAHRDWFEMTWKAVLTRDTTHDAPSPLDEAVALQLLYFPELKRNLQELELAFYPLYQVITDQREEQLKDWTAWSARIPQHLAAYREKYVPYLAAWHAAVTAVTKAVRLRIGA